MPDHDKRASTMLEVARGIASDDPERAAELIAETQSGNKPDIYNRQQNSTKQNWTPSYLPGPRLMKQAVFVLTSKHTFSGAEEFAFDLTNQKRATIVGETTGGGAHPVSGHVVADYFTVEVPFAKSLDPVTKTNWEGTGAEPDVKVPAADALATAEKLAMEKPEANKDRK